MSLLLREALGGSIRRARNERRRTLRDVSRSASVSLGYLSEIERGRKEPSSELLAAICDALALPLPELLDDVADTLRPGARPVPAVDPALRSAVEEAFSDAGTTAAAGATPESSASSSEAAPSASGAPSACATLPTPPEPTDPVTPSTVALPEPEGAEPDVVDPVIGATPVRLVGRRAVAATSVKVVGAAA
jgi:transcriptional regulator with XRE-family HTH domain